MRIYSVSAVSVQPTTAIGMTTADAKERTEGQHVDLETVVDQVHETCLGGELDRPRLTWNGRMTQLKNGHCRFVCVTRMLSVTLDAPDVPNYILDFVMYHELLHKKLGAKMVSGRRYAHTRAFRAADRAFPHEREAPGMPQEGCRSSLAAVVIA